MKVLGGLMGFEECRGRRDHQMGMTNTNGPNATSSGSSEGNYETQVYLNVYDLTPINNYMYWFGLGIFHSGIEVYGVEYGFGAHDFPASGVFEVEPQSCPGFVYRCSILLGRLNMPASEFRKFIENVSSEYHGDTYHLISKNCNHFTADISYRLTGKRIPGWVNRLARVGAMCSCLLPEILQESTVKQLPDDYVFSEEDIPESFSTNTHEAAESDDADQDKHLLSASNGVAGLSFVKEVQR
ncbi:deSI-like protein At4g17486 isoform X3 [Macadamia integrifolia]|uniref:deSI-like protein At4g17486 isoform X3 n=1 Tax=Macadamia integrifolia TaxID=60698 RepID=UPI001C4EA848|nr:deSI-like protein At4g17486 isoform X3 [Macadamia integrifolia]